MGNKAWSAAFASLWTISSYWVEIVKRPRSNAQWAVRERAKPFRGSSVPSTSFPIMCAASASTVFPCKRSGRGLPQRPSRLTSDYRPWSNFDRVNSLSGQYTDWLASMRWRTRRSPIAVWKCLRQNGEEYDRIVQRHSVPPQAESFRKEASLDGKLESVVRARPRRSRPKVLTHKV